jgi:hypothetical protein
VALTVPAVGEPSLLQVELRRRSNQTVMLRLRRRATRQVIRASRIATLRLAGLPHEEVRSRMEISVAEYRKARRWLTAAATESLASDGLLTVDQALERYGRCRIEGVLRVGLLKDKGRAEAEIRRRLGITAEQFGVALEWWRDAQKGFRDEDGG